MDWLGGGDEDERKGDRERRRETDGEERKTYGDGGGIEEHKRWRGVEKENDECLRCDRRRVKRCDEEIERCIRRRWLLNGGEDGDEDVKEKTRQTLKIKGTFEFI